MPDPAAALQRRFPHDVVLVGYGRWVQLAAPDPDIARTARLSVYGSYLDRTPEWETFPASPVHLTVEPIRLLRTGVTTDEAAPAAPTDPVTSANTALPWIFGSLVLLIVLGSGGHSVVRAMRRRQGATPAAAPRRTNDGSSAPGRRCSPGTSPPSSHSPMNPSRRGT